MNAAELILAVFVFMMLLGISLSIYSRIIAARMIPRKPSPAEPVYVPPAAPPPAKPPFQMEAGMEYLYIDYYHPGAGTSSITLRALDQTPETLPFPTQVDEWLSSEGWKAIHSVSTMEGRHEIYQRPKR
jgi:hypothetical protein